MSTTVDHNNQFGGGSGEETECKDNVNTITEGIVSVAVRDDTSTCACCGKEGNSDDMNTCNKCKSVKYCNAACKKKHRTKHKKACERRVAELREEALFKEHPPNEECPICLIPLQFRNKTETFQSCCGKVICNGCIYAMKMSEGKDLCAFCRTPRAATYEECIHRNKKLMESSNGWAFHLLAGCYDNGLLGLQQDYQKANELWLKAGELGCAQAYYNLGVSYDQGRGVEVDKKKAKHYWELAALNGDKDARYAVGYLEGQAGNHHRAFKHLLIAARAGNEDALDWVKKKGFMNGFVTKDEYADALRAYHERQKETKSDARDKAEASDMFSASGLRL